MEKDKLEALLEKYWNAETTVEEEKLIKEHFKHEGTDKLADDDSWFKAVDEARGLIPEDSDIKSIKTTRGFIKFRLNFILKIAGILVLICSVFLGRQYYYAQKIKGEQQIAAQKQMEADLMFMADAFNQGYQSLRQSEIVMSNIKPSKQ